MDPRDNSDHMLAAVRPLDGLASSRCTHTSSSLGGSHETSHTVLLSSAPGTSQGPLATLCSDPMSALWVLRPSSGVPWPKQSLSSIASPSGSVCGDWRVPELSLQDNI